MGRREATATEVTTQRAAITTASALRCSGSAACSAIACALRPGQSGRPTRWQPGVVCQFRLRGRSSPGEQRAMPAKTFGGGVNRSHRSS